MRAATRTQPWWALRAAIAAPDPAKASVSEAARSQPPGAKFWVGFGGPPDAARSPVADYRGMSTAEPVTAHVDFLLEDECVRGISQEHVELAARWYQPWATTSK